MIIIWIAVFFQTLYWHIVAKWCNMLTEHYYDVLMGVMASQITRPQDCLLNRLFRRRSKQTTKFRVAGFYAGNSPGTGEFPAQMASNAGKCFHLMTSSWMWVNIASGDDLLPDDTKPLPEAMLTNCQWGYVALIQDLFHWKCTRYQFVE